MLLMEDRPTIERRALASAAEHERRHGKPHAEILSDRGEWYWLRVTRGREFQVAAHLAGLRFGIYVPTESTTLDGRKLVQYEYAGAVFVYVWDIEQQLRRIQAIPDVLGLRYEHDEPRIMSAEEMKKIRLNEMHRFAKHYKGRTKRSRRADSQHVITEAVRGYTEPVDTESSDTLLRKALGLRVEPYAPRVAGGRSPKGR